MPDIQALERLIAGWQSSLDRVAEEKDRAWPLLEEALDAAESDAAHEEVRATLKEVQASVDSARKTIDELVDDVERFEQEWRAATRYEPDAIARRMEELRTKLYRRPAAGAQDWLVELFDALDARESDAARRVIDAELPWPESLAEGAERIRDGVQQWIADDHQRGLELMTALGDAQLHGWERILTLQLRSRAHRLAAWVALRMLADPERAERHLGEAIDQFPFGGRMHAERAAYFLFVGELDRAVTDAQNAIELARDDVAGFLELGIASELSGEFADADDLYRRALRVLPRAEVARLQDRACLIDPPGRLLIAGADELLESDRPREALEVAGRALLADLRGTEPHPQASIHAIRSRALERLEDRSDEEAAAAAVEAGKLYLWNGDLPSAIEEFKRALVLDDSIPDVGWLLADAVLATSLPFGATVPDAGAVESARQIWDRSAAKVGPPEGDSSWAYVTRAVVSDLASQQLGEERLAGVWEALLYIEKALVHDDVDAQRWGYAAQYLRYLDLEELAFEAAERGYKLGAGDRQVLAERLPRLASRGKFHEAEAAAVELVSMFGEDPWVNAVRAWLAMHSGRDGRYEEALGLLELSIAEGNDPSWYYDMRALCHLALGDTEAALGDYRTLLAESPPIDGTTKCRLAIACTLTGDSKQAERWLVAAADDPTARPITCLIAEALVKVSEEVERSGELLARAMTHAMSHVQVDDTLVEFELRLRALGITGDLLDAAVGVVNEVAAGPARERKSWLEQNPPTPDSELEAALAKYGSQSGQPEEVIETALLAVSARRDAHRRELQSAAESYERLIDSSFEPEATVALKRTLRRLSREHEEAGRVHEVRQTQDRISALGAAGPVEAAIAVSSALEVAGRYVEARELLEARLDSATSDLELEELHQRAGGLALAEGRLESATKHFETALERARRRSDRARIGQLETRLALVSALAGSQGDAVAHLRAAAIAWRAAGAVETVPALLEELRGLSGAPREGSWADALKEVMRIVEATRADTIAGLELDLDSPGAAMPADRGS